MMDIEQYQDCRWPVILGFAVRIRLYVTQAKMCAYQRPFIPEKTASFVSDDWRNFTPLVFQPHNWREAYWQNGTEFAHPP